MPQESQLMRRIEATLAKIGEAVAAHIERVSATVPPDRLAAYSADVERAMNELTDASNKLECWLRRIIHAGGSKGT